MEKKLDIACRKVLEYHLVGKDVNKDKSEI